jgi:uncharacterized membrane protein YkvA (DUF1232 family)
MLKDVWHRQYRMSFLTTLFALFAVAYILSPIDLIPDWIPVLGWIDDGLVLYLLLRVLVGETHRYNRFKAKHRKALSESGTWTMPGA